MKTLEDVQRRKKNMEYCLANEMVTEAGYNQAMASLNKEEEQIKFIKKIKEIKK